MLLQARTNRKDSFLACARLLRIQTLLNSILSHRDAYPDGVGIPLFSNKRRFHHVGQTNHRDHRGNRPFRDSTAAVLCASLQDEEALFQQQPCLTTPGVPNPSGVMVPFIFLKGVSL